MAFYRVRECYLALGERWCNSYLVTYPISYRYNGGITIDGKWYEGFRVVKPKVPRGYELVDIAILPQMNAQPPYVTKYLRPLRGQSLTQIKQDLAKLKPAAPRPRPRRAARAATGVPQG